MTIESPRSRPYALMACVRQEQVISQLETAERALLLVRTLLEGGGAGERIQPSCVLKHIPLGDEGVTPAAHALTPEETIRQMGEALQQLRATLLRS